MKCDSNDEIIVDTSNLLIGSWNAPEYTDDKVVFTKTAKPTSEAYSITFEKNGDFVERSSGWCGTPPLVFSDYKGTWELTEDVIAITQDHFPTNYAWRILSLTDTELIITKELTEREKDHRKLMDLFDDAYEMIEGIPCESAEDWAFTPYGSKACGGPQGYLAYPKTIDTVAFLEKIEIYTQAENDYNKKWSIFSTCDLTPQPKGVECANGSPILKY
ncbi:hypothetical protein MHTCC0001_21600 [Flavobacteriaceae bacterium MHTCC 0001]